MAEDLPQDEEEFEYNDGLGDLLREKEKKEFSWAKTSIVMISLVLVVFIGLTLLFKVGRTMLTQNQMTAESEDMPEHIRQKIEEIEAENKRIIEETEKEMAKQNMAMSDKKTDGRKMGLSGKMKAMPSGKTLSPSKKHASTRKEKITSQGQRKNDKPSRKNTSSTSSISAGKSPYKVIVGNFSNMANAKRLKASLVKVKVETFIWTYKNSKGKTLHVVQAGAYEKRQQANSFVKKLKTKGIDAYVFKR